MEIKEIPRGQLSTIILSTLLDGDKYGYEIIKDIENKSGGKIKIKQPSLYSSLTRMEDQKLISSYWRDSDIGGRRHYYRLTDFGRKQTEQWQNDFVNSNSVVSNLFKDGKNGENFEIKNSASIIENDKDVKENDSQEKPKFLQQENLFSELKKIEKKQEEKIIDTSLPDQINIFDIANKAMENKKLQEEGIEIKEAFIPPPEKHYNVYQELNKLRNQNDVSSFAETMKENPNIVNDEIEEHEGNDLIRKSFADSLKTESYDNYEDDKLDNSQKNEGFEENETKGLEDINKTNEHNNDDVNNLYSSNLQYTTNESIIENINDNLVLENKNENVYHNDNISRIENKEEFVQDNSFEESNVLKNENFHNKDFNETSYINFNNDENKEPIKNDLNKKIVLDDDKSEKSNNFLKKEEKDEGIFITETPDPDTLPKVKKIQPARFTIVSDNPLIKVSNVDNKYNELVEDLYKKGFNDKSSEGYLSYTALEEHYKKNGLKFYPYLAKEVSTQNEKKVKVDNNEFVPINKVNLYKSFIYLALILFETWFSYILLNLFGINPPQLFLYIVISVLAILPVAYNGFLFYKNPEKQLPKEQLEFKQLFINLGIMILGILLTFSFNALFGFSGENFEEYSTLIILPCVLLINFPLSFYVSKLILKKF